LLSYIEREKKRYNELQIMTQPIQYGPGTPVKITPLEKIYPKKLIF